MGGAIQFSASVLDAIIWIDIFPPPVVAKDGGDDGVIVR